MKTTDVAIKVKVNDKEWNSELTLVKGGRVFLGITDNPFSQPKSEKETFCDQRLCIVSEMHELSNDRHFRQDVILIRDGVTPDPVYLPSEVFIPSIVDEIVRLNDWCVTPDKADHEVPSEITLEFEELTDDGVYSREHAGFNYNAFKIVSLNGDDDDEEDCCECNGSCHCQCEKSLVEEAGIDTELKEGIAFMGEPTAENTGGSGINGITFKCGAGVVININVSGGTAFGPTIDHNYAMDDEDDEE